MPGPGLNRVSETPEPGFPRVGTCTNERPAFARRQLGDAVNVRGIDMIGFAGKPVDQLAVPTAVWIQVEHLFDIAAIEDLVSKLQGWSCGVACGSSILNRCSARPSSR